MNFKFWEMLDHWMHLHLWMPDFIAVYVCEKYSTLLGVYDE